jgi:hypothetical protein
MIITGQVSEEDLRLINRRLLDCYGRTENLPNFRLVWSDDEFERRRITHTPEGLALLVPVVQEVPKYKQWIHAKYVLERLTVVPQIAESDLVEKLSYEPIWVFEDAAGRALNPVWSAIIFVLEQLSYNVAHAGMTKYPDKGETVEEKELRLKELQRELFGNETDTGDALAHKEGIVVPYGYSKSQ